MERNFTLLLMLLAAGAPQCVLAQSAPAPKLEFDAASVKQNKSGDPPSSNFPLGPGDVYTPNGGFFSAKGFPLVTYIAFAYKLMGNEMNALLAQLPGWVSTDRFDIQARAEGNPTGAEGGPTKDQMRLMMRSLLADRFKLAVHNETRQMPVFAVLLNKPGTLGPSLRRHPEDSSCTTVPDAANPATTVPGGFPTLCGGILGLPPSAPGRVRAGARNMKLSAILTSLAQIGNLGRPVLDQTGLAGTFDFTLEWTPELSAFLPQGTDPDPTGPTFPEAFREQLGLKLESRKGPVELLVADRVEHPTEN